MVMEGQAQQIKVTQLEVVKKANSTHTHKANGSGWVMVEGVQYAFDLQNAADVEIIAHGHGHAGDASKRLDVG